MNLEVVYDVLSGLKKDLEEYSMGLSGVEAYRLMWCIAGLEITLENLKRLKGDVDG